MKLLLQRLWVVLAIAWMLLIGGGTLVGAASAWLYPARLAVTPQDQAAA